MQFAEKYGFERSDVTLANWRESPFTRFSFSNVSEIVPSAVAPPSRQVSAIKRSTSNDALKQEIITAGTKRSLEEYLEYSETDAFLVWQDGTLVAEYAAPFSDLAKPHIVFSVSKSITGILAGILQDAGELDPARPVSHYMPATGSSGFGDCSLQNLMDMRVSLEFVEEYLNEDGDYARYRRATNWNPGLAGKKPETLQSFLCSLKKGSGPHGGPFRYLSPASDLLGLIVEHVSGMRYMEFLSQHLWQPLGAQFPAFTTVDLLGAPRGAGGVSVAAEDLLRIGIMLLNGGSLNGSQIISGNWVHDMQENGDDAAWARGNFDTFVVGGRYRNQWYQLPRGQCGFFAVGIHGQWLYVDGKTQTVIVKLSSQKIPQEDSLDRENLECFSQLAVAGR